MSAAISRAQIENSIEQHAKLHGVYFWSPSGNAAGRRANEKRWESNHQSYMGVYETHVVQVVALYSESCRNVYYSMKVYVDGKKGTVRTLKKLIGYVDVKPQVVSA